MIKQKSDKKSRIIRFWTLRYYEDNNEGKSRRSNDCFWKSKLADKKIRIEAL